MPHYLFRASYSQDGLRGLLKEGASSRVGVMQTLIQSLGGRMESCYWAFGADDLVIIAELPDNAAAAAAATTAPSLRDRITQVTQMVNQLRAVKKQLTARAELWKENPSAQPLLKQSQELTAKLDELEGKLHNPKAEIPNDLLGERGGGRLYSQLSTLLWWVMGSDGVPTAFAAAPTLLSSTVSSEWPTRCGVPSR